MAEQGRVYIPTEGEKNPAIRHRPIVVMCVCTEQQGERTNSTQYCYCYCVCIEQQGKRRGGRGKKPKKGKKKEANLPIVGVERNDHGETKEREIKSRNSKYSIKNFESLSQSSNCLCRLCLL
ncbi:hypothetical protein Dimus_032000 [Dionaea muscipula]